jgi:hypothetical protein
LACSGGERLGGVGVLDRLLGVARRLRLIGQGDGLTGVGVELLDLVELAVQLHLQLTLVTDHRCRLLRQRLMLTLRLLDSLLNLDLRIRMLFDLGVEEGHHVFPGLHERISHRLIPPPSVRRSCDWWYATVTHQIRAHPSPCGTRTGMTGPIDA